MIMNRTCLPTILAASPTGLEFDGAPALAAPKPDSNEDVADRTMPLVAHKAASARDGAHELNFERLRVSQLERLQ